MAELVSRVKKFFSGKPFALWVIFGGLLYFGVALLLLIIPVVVVNPALLGDPFLITFLVFALVFFFAAFLGFTGKRWALVVTTVVSILFLALLGPLIAGTLVNPANEAFPLAISGVPALLLTAIFSILSLANFKKGIASRKSLATPESPGGLFTIAVVGFVIGGLVVGAVAAVLIGQLLENQSGDVKIVRGATAAYSNGGVPYRPAAFTIRRGDTVTWVNSDTMIHTVTSNVSGLFDSGDLTSGARFSHIFPDTGTFEYHCTPHSTTMWATIVVTP